MLVFLTGAEVSTRESPDSSLVCFLGVFLLGSFRVAVEVGEGFLAAGDHFLELPVELELAVEFTFDLAESLEEAGVLRV